MTTWRSRPTRVQDGFGSEYTKIAFANGSHLDAFGRLRVSNPALTLFDSQQHFNEQPLLWDTKTVGSGAILHSPDEAGTFMTVTQDGDHVIRQTKKYHRYQPGKSQFIKATGTMSSDNGIMYVVQRSSVSGNVVEQRVPQDFWNHDKFDGRGPSSVRLNQDKSQIFVMDLEWLSVGQVRMGFVAHGCVHHCHIFENENTNPGAYMSTANLPLRYEIKAESGVLIQSIGYFDEENGVFFEKRSPFITPASLLQICSVVESEGGFEETLGIPYADDSGSVLSIPNVETPLFSIRPKALFNGIKNHGQIIPLGFDVSVESYPCMFRVKYASTLVGASWVSFGPNSMSEVDKSATSLSGGLNIFSVPVGASNRFGSNQSSQFVSKLPISIDIDGNNDTVLTLTAQSMASQNCDVLYSVSWREIY